jgi:hypothetical protein
MKKWTVTHSNDFDTFNKTEIEGKTYTDAYVNFMCKHPGEMISELELKEE